MELFNKLLKRLIGWSQGEKSAELEEELKSFGKNKEELLRLNKELERLESKSDLTDVDDVDKEEIKKLKGKIKRVKSKISMFKLEAKGRWFRTVRLFVFSFFTIPFILITVGWYIDIGKSWWWSLLLGVCFVSAVVLALIHYWNAPRREEELLVTVGEHEVLKRNLRKSKKELGYNKQRRRVLAKMIQHAEKVRNFLSSSKIDEFEEKELKPVEKEMKKVNDGLEPIKNDITAIKESRYKLEKFLVGQCYMPFVALLIFSVIFLVFLFISLTFKDAQTFEWLTRGFYSVIIMFGVYYILSSRVDVTSTDRGVKSFRDKLYGVVTRGQRLAYRGLVSIIEITTEVQRYDMAPIKAKIADRPDQPKKPKHSQAVFFDASILFHLERPIDAITELGPDMKAIFKKLTGSEDLKKRAKPKEGDMIGIITDLVSSYIREFIAEWVYTLDAAYQIRDELEVELSDLLKEDLEYLGIRIDSVFITDVRGTDEIEKARNEREQADVDRGKATIVADTVIETARGKAVEKEKIGKAEAYVVECMGGAEANIAKLKIIAKIEGITSIDESTKQIAIKAVPLLMAAEFGKEIIPSVAQAFGNTTFNVFAIAEIKEAVEKVLGAFNFFSSAEAPVGGGS